MDFSETAVRIQNFRAIKDADIKLNGLTVLSGLNGSGKSTIAKTLYYAIKTALNYESILDSLVFNKIIRNIQTFSVFADDFLRSMAKQNLAALNAVNLGSLLHLPAGNEEEIINTVESFFVSFEELTAKIDKVPDASQREKLLGLLARANKVLDPLISETGTNSTQREIDQRFVSKLKNQLSENRAKKDHRKLEDFVELCRREFGVIIPENFSYREKDIEIFDHSEDRVRPVQETGTVYYIDTPWIIDFLRGAEILRPLPHTHWEDILEKVKIQDSGSEHSNFSHEIAKTIKGYASFRADEMRLTFDRTDAKPFPLRAAAMGIKSFSIIQRLAEKHSFDEKTLLILDEPESHLHPQWIVEYARILVLMQKQLGVKMLIASHSPDMIDALQTFSASAGIADRTNFYLAEETEPNSFSYAYKPLGNSIAKIFKAFNVAAARIAAYEKNLNDDAAQN